MALSEDQKAMLRLLAQREQGYEDLAALMGLSVEEVRAKVTDALAQLDADEAIPPPPEPPASAPPQSAPPPPPPPTDSPQEEQPPPAAAPPASGATAAAGTAAADTAGPARKRAASRPRLTLPSGRGAQAALAAAVVVLVAVIVVLALSGGGSGSNSPGAGSGTTATGSETNPTVDGKEVTEARLEAVNGSGASGVALFGRVKNSLALQVEASGLAQSGKGQAYTIWIAQSPRKMLPLASTAEVKNGDIAAQFKVPTGVLNYLAAGTFDQLEVTRTETAALEASLHKAASEKKAPAYTGDAVLRGTITGPIVGAAQQRKKE